MTVDPNMNPATGRQTLASNSRWTMPTLFGLFIISGFAALIYQSIWTQYLGLMLGHAAYAQTLVLATFMGGMALGAYIAGQKAPRLGNLLQIYAGIEVLIGLAGIVFHDVFTAQLDFAQTTVLSALAPMGLGGAYQWLVGVSLILPQCVLLGATFPILSAACLRLGSSQDSGVLGGLYFSNSVGAGFGVLVATFTLLPAVGMPGALLTAGLLNILVALCAWRIGKSTDIQSPAKPPEPAEQGSGSSPARLFPIILMGTFLSGAFSFVYEIGWIRMLNQALGTSIHSFELMLAAFIFGLAFGGLWVRRRGDKLQNPLKTVAIAQVLMGLAALISVVVFTNSFGWVGWLINAAQPSVQGYTLFNAGSAAIAMLVMFPAAFFAGMTLPLFTVILIRHGHGEKSIGQVYAANTLGSIAGVMLAVHVLIPMLGIRLAVTIAALGDALLGLYLLAVFLGEKGRATLALASVVTVVVLLYSLVMGQADPLQQASGVFRQGRVSLPPGYTVPYLKDGKTTTVSVFTNPDNTVSSIATNGKVDAGLGLDPTAEPMSDELTMVMAAALPLTIHPAPRDIAIIGWGSGLTTHTLLGSEQPALVESVEIEAAMVEGARLFGQRNERGYTDPRSKIIIDDARTHFSSGDKRYDVIISEPSNPWVSGNAQLFTQEFYGFLDSHLHDDGLLIQWLHTYELSDALLGQMVKALIDTFPYTQVYVSSGSDLLLVASRSVIPTASSARITEPTLQKELARVGLVHDADYALRNLGDQSLLRTYTNMLGSVSHSDYFPTVALNAPRDRFMRRSASLLQHFHWHGLLASELVLGRSALDKDQPSTPMFMAPKLSQHQLARAVLTMLDGETSDHEDADSIETALRGLTLDANGTLSSSRLTEWTRHAQFLANITLGVLPPNEFEKLWGSESLVPRGLHPLVDSVMLTLKAADSRDLETMHREARRLLENHLEDLPPQLNEIFLVLAMSVAARDGDFEQSRILEDTFGASPHVAQEKMAVRALLLAWSQRESA